MAKLIFKNKAVADVFKEPVGLPRAKFSSFANVQGSMYAQAQAVAEATDTKGGLIIKYRRKPYLIKQGVVSKYLWSYEFQLNPIITEIYLKDIPGYKTEDAFTLNDFYGEALDGNKRKIDVRFIGYAGNRKYDPDGAYHPCSLEEYGSKLSPDGEVDYDEDLQLLSFKWGTNSTRIYRIQKIASGYVQQE